MQGRSPNSTWNVLVLSLHEPDGQKIPVFTPVPPKNPEANPRYACGRCEHVLLTGIPLVELLQRARQDRLLIRCPSCDALSATKVARSGRAPVAPMPTGGAGRWHIARASQT